MTPAPGVTASLGELIALRGRIIGQARPARVAHTAGSHTAAHHSRGMEFAEARPYQPGDDVRSIDWRQTARRGRVYTKLFREEHARPVWLFVDVGASMRFGTRVAFKSVQAARAAALLSWMAAGTGDRVGGVVWNGDAPHIVPARHSDHGVLQLLRCIADASAAAPASGPADMAVPLRALERALPPQATVVLLSDFAKLDQEAAHTIAILGRRAHLVLAHVYDEFEAAPPPGRYRVTDGDRHMALDLHDETVRAAYAVPFVQRRAALQALARQAGATLLPLPTGCALEPVLARAFPGLAGPGAAA